MAEASNRLEKTILVIAAAAVPAGGALYFKEHPVLAAVTGEVLVFAAAFVTKVWDKIETQYADAVAKAAPSKIEAFVTRYQARYRRAMYFLHRSFDVKGLNTQGAISLELDQEKRPPHRTPVLLFLRDIASSKRRRERSSQDYLGGRRAQVATGVLPASLGLVGERTRTAAVRDSAGRTG